MNEWSNIEIFSNNKSTLKETSYDDANDVFMTESEFEVIDFDDVKEQYLLSKNSRIEELKSADALLNCDQRIVFVEFKNGSMNREKQGIREKMKDSMFILADLLSCTIDYIRDNVTFVIIYNKRKNPRTSQSMDKFADIVSRLGHDRICRFGFDGYRNLYFKKIITYNDEQFNEDIKKSTKFEDIIKMLPYN